MYVGFYLYGKNTVIFICLMPKTLYFIRLPELVLMNTRTTLKNTSGVRKDKNRPTIYVGLFLFTRILFCFSLCYN